MQRLLGRDISKEGNLLLFRQQQQQLQQLQQLQQQQLLQQLLSLLTRNSNINIVIRLISYRQIIEEYLYYLIINLNG